MKWSVINYQYNIKILRKHVNYNVNIIYDI